MITTMAHDEEESAMMAAQSTERQRYVYIETLGCQMNVYDTERMGEALAADNYSHTDDRAVADLIVINTCSVREKSEHKMISLLGKLRPLKEHNPELVLAVSGCVAQQEGERLLKKVPHLDIVLGPDQIAALPGLVREARDEHARAAATAFINRKEYEFVQAGAPTDGRVTSFVTVMKGCNKFCSFCIVPTTRGREMSKPSDDIVAEVEKLVGAGVREVTLLGQNVNSYGLDKRGRQGADGEVDFAGLIDKVAQISGLERIRFTTSHPMDCSDALIDAFATQPKLMPWFHLPIQSGSERVLRMMRRRTVIDEYVARIERLQIARPDIAMSSDIIVGFPGETDADFELTMDLLRKLRFSTLFAFMYSPRPGTAAARIPDDVPLATKKARLHALQALQNEITAEWLASFMGQEIEVLFEGPSTQHARGAKSKSLAARPIGGPPQLMGRTPHNIKVNVETTDYYALRDWPGRLARVRIDHVGRHSLNGSLIGFV
ncbi:MAG: tRNA (N6-isopentenyl adenosine(37)-C2)-methylthiotransferase MiaB [Myxococcales bacterium]|nr:tRNA (N6-isopentenyl adenosine(37)-C2)-methylthiotransferase MiaB [Myxococcales bacterium]